MEPRMFSDLDELRAAMDTPLGESDWVTIDQPMIDRFAQLTFADHWSHVDVERSAASPFGGTIAQGMLVLSLGPPLARRIYTVAGFEQSLNYGFDRVRFVRPVPVGSRIRVSPTVVAVDESDAGVRVTARLTFEAEGVDGPVCVADMLSHHRR
ncbi:MAG: hypothetical protein CL424_04390 [Acidimicrobiaceae bacterium]|nr:hypothetical protein [Acidimicrobiaceae bacterium]